jgi:hypothetical protein
MSDADELALYNQLKDLPDFRSYPLPVSWFKKFNIPPIEVTQPGEFINSGYTIKCGLQKKDFPPLIIREPQKDKDGKVKLVEVAPPEDIKVETISRPFENKDPFLTVLPMIAELANDAS